MYTISCSNCNYNSTYQFDTLYEYVGGREELCTPKSSQGWCYDCEKVVVIYRPFDKEDLNKEIDSIDEQIKWKSEGIFADICLKFSSKKKKEIDELNKKKTESYEALSKCVAFFEGKKFRQKCLTCGSYNVKIVNLPDSNNVYTKLNIKHECGGDLLIKEFARVSFTNMPKVIYDISGKIVVDERDHKKKSPSKLYKKTNQYSVIWQKCGDNSGLAERFYVPGYQGYLPFFIWGVELEAMERKERIELREDNLIKGILYGLYEFDNAPKPWHQKEDKKTLLYLLDVLGNGFKFASPEKMILDIAYDVREKNGNTASHIILKVGNNLMPESSKIKSDLICDLWAVISSGSCEDDLLEDVLELVKCTNLDQIHPLAKEIICYYGFCAMMLKGQVDLIDTYLKHYIYPNVTNEQLKQNIKNLLDNPNGYTPKDLKIT
ncbi:MAG: hypothetical protein HQK72_07635 [Desulfamplus sp.]|nr:hypothetical protein [Desulfamplus sp.]